MSEPSAPDLRSLLREAAPRDFPVKAAWQEVVRLLRSRKRRTGEAAGLSSWAAVQRALDTTPLQDSLGELKPLLRSVLREKGGEDAAARIDTLVSDLLPREASGRLRVAIEGWPPDFGSELRERLLRRRGSPPLSVSAPEAAALVREFDGMQIAGHTLRVRVELAAGEVLPSVPRSMRARPPRRGRKGPWLPFFDEVGRRSLTPRKLAERQARRLASSFVIDGYCGLGGNALALARAGARVIGVDCEASRLKLAARNAEALGLQDRIRWVHGDISTLLPKLPRDADLLLDPPWDPFPTLLPLELHRRILLKLPASYDVACLGLGDCRVFYEFGELGDDDAHVLRMLTVLYAPGAGNETGY